MKKPIVSIIELHYHAEVLQTLLNVIDFEKFHFQLFIAESVARNIKISPNIDAFIVKENINQFAEELKNSDILFFNTLADYFDEVLPYIKSKKAIVRIHNVNTWFGKQGMAKPQSNYEAWKFSSHFIRKELFGKLSSKRQQAIDHIDQFIFPVDFMKQEAIRLRPDLSTKFKYSPIPLVYQKEIANTQSDIKHIVIPGRIDKRKKDYDFALRVIRMFSDGYSPNSKLKISLLGRPEGSYGKRIINHYNQLAADKNIQIATYGSYISQEKFDETMNEASLLFLPLVNQTSYTMYREFYGKTKISGAVNDCLQYTKHALLPSFYPIANSNFHSYNGEDDAENLLSILLTNQMQTLISEQSEEKIKNAYNDLFAL